VTRRATSSLEGILALSLHQFNVRLCCVYLCIGKRTELHPADERIKPLESQVINLGLEGRRHFNESQLQDLQTGIVEVPSKVLKARIKQGNSLDGPVAIDIGAD